MRLSFFVLLLCVCVFFPFCRRGTVRCRRGCGGGVRCGDARLQLNKLSSCVIRCYRECVQTFGQNSLSNAAKLLPCSFGGASVALAGSEPRPPMEGRGGRSQSQTPAGGLGSRVQLLSSSRNQIHMAFCFIIIIIIILSFFPSFLFTSARRCWRRRFWHMLANDDDWRDCGCFLWKAAACVETKYARQPTCLQSEF